MTNPFCVAAAAYCSNRRKRGDNKCASEEADHVSDAAAFDEVVELFRVVDDAFDRGV